MLKRYVEILRNRPYFGGIDNKSQVRKLNEIQEHIVLIKFDIYNGALKLICVTTYPFTVCSDWCFYYQEIGTLKMNHSKRLCLAKYSVIPYNDGTWEKHQCLLKVDVTKLGDIRNINIKEYQPQYY